MELLATLSCKCRHYFPSNRWAYIFYKGLALVVDSRNTLERVLSLLRISADLQDNRSTTSIKLAVVYSRSTPITGLKLDTPEEIAIEKNT